MGRARGQSFATRSIFDQKKGLIANLSADQLEEYRQVFKLVDKDGGGSIDAAELAEGMRNLGLHPTDDEVSEMIDCADEDGSGSIEFEEFVTLMLMAGEKDTPGGLTDDDVQELCGKYPHFSEEQIRRLHRRFCALDEDGNGELSIDEFKRYPDIAENPLLKRVIEIFDTDGDETVSFMEFVRALAIFSQDSEQEKLKFTFRVYDIDGDGWISNLDLFRTLQLMVGDNLTPAQLQQIVDKTFVEVDLNNDGLISYAEFKKACERQNLADKLALPAI